MFDIDFCRQIYRLNGWEFDPEKTARPGVIGHCTNDIYDRLTPGVKSALHDRMRRNANGRPTQKLTPSLTVEKGKPRLREMLEGVKLLMRMSDSWAAFVSKLDEFYPRMGDTLQLPLRGGNARLNRPSGDELDGDKPLGLMP